MLYPYYFASYARLDDNKYTKLRDSLEELRERVRALMGATDVKEVGFIDLDGVETGEEWVQKLGRVVANCRVLVCFCSRTYFNRPVCGKEFEIFRSRLPAGATHRYVFPVIWDKCDLPKAVYRFNTLHRDFPKEYLEDGLCALRRLRREAEYETTIEALARSIADAASSPHLAPGVHPVDFDGTASAFDNPMDDAVSVGVLSDSGLFSVVEIGRTVRAIVEEAARDVGWRQWIVDDQVVERLDRSDRRGDAMILVVPSSLGSAWRVRLGEIDRWLTQKASGPLALLVAVESSSSGGSGISAASAEGALRAALPLSGPGSAKHDVYISGSAESLLAKIRAAITRLRMDLVSRRAVARVDDPNLEAYARGAGVPIDNRPLIVATEGGV